MNWCFAKVNYRLAEIYFEKNKENIKIIGHCYVSKEEYKTKKEQIWIDSDINKFQFKFKEGKYQKI